MIRIVTAKRLALLEADTHAAFERARQVNEAAREARDRHTHELTAATDRAERADATTTEVGALLARAVEELSAAQQELLLKDIEIRRLRETLSRRPREGETLTVLLHYGEPHTIYASREDAYADTATHGVPANAKWVPVRERPPAASKWCLEAFIYDAASNGFRRGYMPAPKSVGEAA
ncbi:hypothetical protein ACFVOR_19170 [Streptomyces sp. NPDC057837]|uniref:hypothetical protein n=1 Tax=Streptomyces sp. NPDC057837 TaxID=3346260 RepID=UPI0036A9920A